MSDVNMKNQFKGLNLSALNIEPMDIDEPIYEVTYTMSNQPYVFHTPSHTPAPNTPLLQHKKQQQQKLQQKSDHTGHSRSLSSSQPQSTTSTKDTQSTTNVNQSRYKLEQQLFSEMTQLTIKQDKIEKALSAIAYESHTQAINWLIRHNKDSILNSEYTEPTREFILLLCPVGRLAGEIELFLNESRTRCGPNEAHYNNQMPYMKLTPFFKLSDSQVINLHKAFDHLFNPKSKHSLLSQTSEHKLSNHLREINTDLHVASQLVLLYLDIDSENYLKELIQKFCQILSKVTSTEIIPYSKQLHLTLACQFSSEHKRVLEELAIKYINYKNNADWEIRLYSRDSRLEGKQTYKVVNTIKYKSDNTISLKTGDYIYSDTRNNSNSNGSFSLTDTSSSIYSAPYTSATPYHFSHRRPVLTNSPSIKSARALNRYSLGDYNFLKSRSRDLNNRLNVPFYDIMPTLPHIPTPPPPTYGQVLLPPQPLPPPSHHLNTISEYDHHHHHHQHPHYSTISKIQQQTRAILNTPKLTQAFWLKFCKNGSTGAPPRTQTTSKPSSPINSLKREHTNDLSDKSFDKKCKIKPVSNISEHTTTTTPTPKPLNNSTNTYNNKNNNNNNTTKLHNNFQQLKLRQSSNNLDNSNISNNNNKTKLNYKNNLRLSSSKCLLQQQQQAKQQHTKPPRTVHSTGETASVPLKNVERANESDTWQLHRSQLLAQNPSVSTVNTDTNGSASNNLSNSTTNGSLPLKHVPLSASNILEVPKKKQNTTAAPQPPPPSDLNFVILRHGERVDLVFGPQWIETSFDRNGTYRRNNLNMPSSLPQRQAKRDYNGDSPITEIGKFQAKMTGTALNEESFKFDYCYVSPSLRCIQTAHHVLQSMGLEKTCKLRIEPSVFEFLGWYEKGAPNFLHFEPLINCGYNIDTSYKPIITVDRLQNDESYTDYYIRSFNLMKHLTNVHQREGGNILVVGHAATLEVCSRQITGQQIRSYSEFNSTIRKVSYLGNCLLQKKPDQPFEVLPTGIPQLSHGATFNFDAMSLRT